MAEARLEPGSDRREVNARIVYWGASGAGKATNLRSIHRKLRPDHRGKLEAVPTRLDPSVCSYKLPIELGEIAGVKTRIQVIAVPGGPEQAPTRKQLLDRVDGIVFVVDARRERIDDNVAALEELRGALAAYGRALESVPLVVQYNRQDQSDPYVLEELHRKLDVKGAAVFEATALDGTGVLPTLTTISKRVVKQLRETPAPRQQPNPIAGPANGAGEAGAVRSEPQANEDHQARGLASTQIGRPRPMAVPVAPEPIAALAPAASGSGRDTAILADLERAALSPDVEVEDERDHAVSRAQGLLDAAWQQEVAVLDAPLGETPLPSAADALFDDDRWQVVEAGLAEIIGTRAIAVPVVIADGPGRELRFRLTVSLELLVDE
jgi:signal recognition particle receptor subunit beta